MMAFLSRLLIQLLLLSVLISHSLIASAADAHKESNRVIIEELGLRESQQTSREMKGWRPIKKVVLWGSEDEVLLYKKNFPNINFVASQNSSEVKQHLQTADAFLGYCIPELFDSAIDIAWMHSMAVGVEGCVNSLEFKNSVRVLTNAQRLSAPEIAEHAIAMMFSLVRRLDQYAHSQNLSKWDRALESGDDKIWEINGRTILVVGLGGIGTEVAKRASALGMKVTATRNSSRKGPDYVSYVGLSDELLTLAKSADIVVNTVPLTAKTTALFDRRFFKAMKSTAYFINVARGRSVVTDDLIAALDAEELAGAGLDVTDPEPLPRDHLLWRQPRVIITPHIAYRSDKLRERVRIINQENLYRYVNGEKLLSLVNITRGY